MANQLLGDCNAPPVGKRWATNFVKRQPQLETRFFRRYDYKRAQCEDPEVIRKWFNLVQNIINKYGITNMDIYNFDETGFMMGITSTGMVVTSTRSGIAEGEGIQAQNDTEVQIREEVGKSSGRKPRTETKQWQCGTCGKAGHNARTCQKMILSD